MQVPLVPSEAQAAILAWYDARGRALPFRGQRDPYAILVSEVMAQPTQISRVSEQWATFMATFPSVESLADAPTADVLRAWRGLGYNRRASISSGAARVIVSEHRRSVPSSLDQLLRLPGVGPSRPVPLPPWHSGARSGRSIPMCAASSAASSAPMAQRARGSSNRSPTRPCLELGRPTGRMR